MNSLDILTKSNCRQANDLEFVKTYSVDMSIADILHIAADKHLKHNNTWSVNKTEYTCLAILRAMTHGAKYVNLGVWVKHNPQMKRIMKGLCNMGFKIRRDVGTAFIQYENDAQKRQSARYMWLKLAALMAEEQGV